VSETLHPAARISGWLLPFLLLAVAAAIGWYSGLLQDLLTTLME
jgi:hypothetical protein